MALKALMQRSKSLFKRKPDVEFGEIIERRPQVAVRYFNGSRVPDAITLRRLVRAPQVGAEFVALMVADLPPAQRDQFFLGIMRAASRG